MARTLKVFVSCAVDELADERIALKEALLSLPLSVGWDFDFTSGGVSHVSQEYLERVWEADLYFLMIGQRVPEAVQQEYRTALESEKPAIALLQDTQRDPEAKAFVRALKSKPRPRLFSTVEDVQRHAMAGVSDELIKLYRKLRLDEAEMKELARQRVESLAKERQQSRDWRSSAVMMVTLIAIVIVAIVIGRGENNPPVIERLIIEPSVVPVGGEVQVRAQANDPENGTLTYEWLSDAGAIDTHGFSESASVTLRAPEKPGKVHVRVRVTDPGGLEVDETGEIEVVQK